MFLGLVLSLFQFQIVINEMIIIKNKKIKRKRKLINLFKNLDFLDNKV